MSEYALQTYFTNPDQAKACISHQIGPFCKKMWANGAGRLTVTVVPEEDSKSEQQRKYYHAVVLTEIADQAKANGQKFPMPVWKEHFRKTYLGSKRKTFANPLTGKKQSRLVRISTEDLSVKAYSKLIDQVTAFAATELGVMFSVPRWEDYRP
jgi:hypothetical protein